MSETVEKVILSKVNGEIGIAIRVSFYDKAHREPLAKMKDFSISLSSNEYEGWIYQDFVNETPIWVFINKDFFEERCEILGPL